MPRYRKVDRRPPARTGEANYSLDVLREGTLYGTAPPDGGVAAYVHHWGGFNTAPCQGRYKEDGLFTGAMSYKKTTAPVYYAYKHANGIGHGISTIKGEDGNTAPWVSAFTIQGPFATVPPGGPDVYLHILP